MREDGAAVRGDGAETTACGVARDRHPRRPRERGRARRVDQDAGTGGAQRADEGPGDGDLAGDPVGVLLAEGGGACGVHRTGRDDATALEGADEPLGGVRRRWSCAPSCSPGSGRTAPDDGSPGPPWTGAPVVRRVPRYSWGCS